MVRAAVPEKFMQRTGTICENARASTLNCCEGVVPPADRAAARACLRRNFVSDAGIRLTALALPEPRISQLQSCATAAKGRLWPVSPAHG